MNEDCDVIFERASNWYKSLDIRPEEIGRFIAFALLLITISYVILLVARVVVALTFPTLIMTGLLIFYRLVSPVDVQDALKELLISMFTFIADSLFNTTSK
ncbi:hypothetical protein KR009_011780 [Drosophila setifemur]|nr:hypothetical protein KR009_011780 [Drosophila setifemur]